MSTQVVHVRLPRDLHERLKAAADRQGMSINTVLVAMVAAELGFKLEGGKQ